tara:strand:- start:635 stop:1135 length:501 start_codon:yes stop_codon:yes gene_type:complete
MAINPSQVNPLTLGVFEIFKAVSEQKTTKDKVAALQHYDCFAIRSVLQGCYHPDVKFLLPDSIPPYGEADGIQVETRLHSMVKRFDIFVEGGRATSTQTKREMLFIELLESVHPEDAKILLNMIAKKDPYKGTTEAVTRSAFPDLLPEKPKAKPKAKAKSTKKAEG